MEWIVDYSELVVPETADGLQIDQEGIPCERLPVAAGRFVGACTSLCDSTPVARAPLNIHANSGFVSTLGVRATPLAVSLFADGMEPAGPGCTIVRFPPPD